MVGGNGDDELDGGATGNDVLVGGLGQDSLGGGGDADRSVYTGVADSTVAAADTIEDFNTSGGDIIDLSLIDANTAAAGDQAFAFIGTGAFTGIAGQLRYQQSGGDTFVQGDVNGDGVADFMIMLTGTLALTGSGSGSDFIL